MSVDNTLEFPDIMVDIETTGLNHNNNAIIQIAAAKFNLEKGTVSHVFFDRCLMIPPQRYWDEGTRTWWLKSPDMRETLQGILGRGEDARTVLQSFSDWAGPNTRFWGKPTHFDFSFLQNYFESFDLAMPFFFRDANDMNSWIRARYWPNEAPDLERELEFTGQMHNALHDTLHQMKVLFAHKENTKNQILTA